MNAFHQKPVPCANRCVPMEVDESGEINYNVHYHGPKISDVPNITAAGSCKSCDQLNKSSKCLRRRKLLIEENIVNMFAKKNPQHITRKVLKEEEIVNRFVKKNPQLITDILLKLDILNNNNLTLVVQDYSEFKSNLIRDSYGILPKRQKQSSLNLVEARKRNCEGVLKLRTKNIENDSMDKHYDQVFVNSTIHNTNTWLQKPSPYKNIPEIGPFCASNSSGSYGIKSSCAELKPKSTKSSMKCTPKPNDLNYPSTSLNANHDTLYLEEDLPSLVYHKCSPGCKYPRTSLNTTDDAQYLENGCTNLLFQKCTPNSKYPSTSLKTTHDPEYLDKDTLEIHKELQSLVYQGSPQDPLDVVRETQNLFSYHIIRELELQNLTVPSFLRQQRYVPDNMTKLVQLVDAFKSSQARVIVRDRAETVELSSLNFSNFTQMLFELFQNGGVTCERIMVLFFFCADLLIRTIRDHLMFKFLSIFDWTMTFLSNHLSRFVFSRGGWETILIESSSYRFRILRGFTLSIGAFALIVCIWKFYRNQIF